MIDCGKQTNNFFEVTKSQNIQIVAPSYVLILRNKGEGGKYSKEKSIHTIQTRILFKEIM